MNFTAAAETYPTSLMHKLAALEAMHMTLGKYFEIILESFGWHY
jgi:hypothetical protein